MPSDGYFAIGYPNGLEARFASVPLQQYLMTGRGGRYLSGSGRAVILVTPPERLPAYLYLSPGAASAAESAQLPFPPPDDYVDEAGLPAGVITVIGRIGEQFE